MLVTALEMPYRAAAALSLATGMEAKATWRMKRRDIVFGDKPAVNANGGKTQWLKRTVRGTDLWMWRSQRR